MSLKREYSIVGIMMKDFSFRPYPLRERRFPMHREVYEAEGEYWMRLKGMRSWQVTDTIVGDFTQECKYMIMTSRNGQVEFDREWLDVQQTQDDASPRGQ